MAGPMPVLDIPCYYIIKSTPKNAQDEAYTTNLEQVTKNIAAIRELQIELEKYPRLLLEEFISIYSKNTVILEDPAKFTEKMPIP